jgi:DNA integrity scanning protein DisA with diadenylate cyclase activity
MKGFALEKWRSTYIREELLHNGFGSDPSGLIDLVVEEVAYAVFAPVHEGKRPTYGALVAQTTDDLAHSVKDEFDGDFSNCGIESRYCADGISGFFLRGKRGCKLLVCGKGVAFRDEAALFLLRDKVLFAKLRRSPQKMPTQGERDLVLVHRGENDTVTVMHWDGITQFSKGLWSFKSYQYNLCLEETMAARSPGFSEERQDVLRSILSMCVNILSPAGCGATIVMRLNDDEAFNNLLNLQNAIIGTPQIQIRYLNYQYALAHILKQCDGAAIISESGDLEHVGIWLAPEDRLLRSIKSQGGSRQLTAQATSMKIDSPILTVSSDGPVRAFHRGDMICNSSSSGPPRVLDA